jgi:hypothetical protein
MAVDFLPELTDSQVKVEIAWGADLSDVDGSGWTWTDITTDVRIADGISLSLGRADEASTSQPAKIGMTLDNADDSYSLGGISPNWPNVRRNTPVRVSIDVGDGNGFIVACQGFADGFTPGWTDDNGKIPTVALSASGLLRRLTQGSDPLASALYRWHTISATPVDYWALEEDKTATFGLSSTGGLPATITPFVDTGVSFGKVNWGGDTDNPATERAVAFSAGAELDCPPADTSVFSSTGVWAASWIMRYTSISGAKVRIETVDGSWAIALTYFTDGSVDLILSEPFPTGDTTEITYTQGDFTGWDNVWHAWALVVDNTGASQHWELYRDGIAVTGVTVSAAPSKSSPAMFKSNSTPNPGGTEDPITMGHVALWNADPTGSTYTSAVAAWTGETATDRLTRLADEQGFGMTIIDDGTLDTDMGPQLPVALVNLLRECETADQGVLFDGFDAGLTYFTRTLRENADVALSLTADELVAPFAPTDDDQRNRNRVTANTTGSSSKFQFQDTDGPLGVDTIGLYDSSIEVNIDDQDQAIDYASWLVHLGTVEGLRYPSFTLNLRATPTLASSVMVLATSDRVAVDNTAGTLTGLPAEVFNVLVEGLSMQLDPFNWLFTANLSPAGTWAIATVAAATGDTGDFLMRLDTDDSEVHTSASLGATSLSVTTNSGPLWTTTADDFPFDISVGGLKVHVTNITGASSPQTFTVSALSKARAAGLPLAVWDPPVLGLG